MAHDPLVDTLAARLAPDIARAVTDLVAADHQLAERRLLMSTAEAAAALDVSTDTVRDLIADGHLEYVDGIGRGRKIVVASLAAWVDSRRRKSVA